MILELMLAVLGILIVGMGLWDIASGNAFWGILFLIGGLWSFWLGIRYLVQSRRQKKRKKVPEGRQIREKQGEPHSSERGTVKPDKGLPSLEEATILEESISEEEMMDETPVEVELVSDSELFTEMITEAFFGKTSKDEPEDELPEEIDAEVIEEDPVPIRFASAEIVQDERLEK